MMRWHRRGDHPVDTHVLIHHSRTRPHWLDQCLASMEGEPTNILLVDSPSTNVGALRAMAMREGTAPFLSFVDDDDFVMPGAFDACLAAINDPGIVGAYTNFADVNLDGRVTRYYPKSEWSPRQQITRLFEVLHVHVYRRAPALKYLDEVAQWPTLEESVLMARLVNDGEWRRVDFDGYRKRKHRFGAGSRITPALHREALRISAEVLSPMIARKTLGERAAGVAVKAIDYADRKGWGCASCAAARARARARLTR